MEPPAPPPKAKDGGPPVPSWALSAEAGAAESPFSLEVIKDGVSVERVRLDRARFLVGRAADVVPMSHSMNGRVRLGPRR